MDYHLQGAAISAINSLFPSMESMVIGSTSGTPKKAFRSSPDKCCRRCLIENESSIHKLNKY